MRTRTLLLAAALLLAALPAAAQWIPCLNDPPGPAQSALPPIPELISEGGKLHGTILLISQEQRMTFRQPPGNNQGNTANKTKCAPQYVRVFEGVGALPALPVVPKGGYPDPMPGPTLRARVGDIVELTFLNQVDPGDFGDSVDRGDFKTGTGCDETSIGYPGTDPKGDKYPNCFHGSTTANIHFHGTHTNPNATADNVFIEVRPSPRKDGKPTVTRESVREPFESFFKKCETMLTNPLMEWPKTWADMPLSWTTKQTALIKKYDETPGIKPLWPVNREQIRKGLWPQYYVGSYPYCFRLPDYTDSTYPPTASATIAHTPHSHGAGEAEQKADKTAEESPKGPSRPLMMGQAPGTHWYHAHKHGSTAIDVSNGMTGAFIIEGKYDDDLNAFYNQVKLWTRTQPTMVINQLGVSPNLERGAGGHIGRGPDFSVNGRLNPIVTMAPGSVQLWRIVNTSSRSGVYFTGPPAGFTWMQLSQDGVQFTGGNYGKSKNKPFLLASGNRADILVQAPVSGGPYSVLVQNEVNPEQRATNTSFALLTVQLGDTAQPMDLLPDGSDPAKPYPLSFPPFLTDIKASDINGTKKIVFATQAQVAPPTTPAIHTIDGKQFDGEVGAVVLLNRVEEWKVLNAGIAPNISHPFHIHINPFQVTEVFEPASLLKDASGKYVLDSTGKTVPMYVTDPGDKKYDGQCVLDPLADPDSWKACDAKPDSTTGRVWWDVFPIPSGIGATKGGQPINGPDGKQIIIPGYFKMRSRFVDYAGYYVIHCHILAHEDRGMMTVVEVAPLSSPYSHH
jgi:FtsP/CotA-like multicopper oxidase with cupredoxin domain